MSGIVNYCGKIKEIKPRQTRTIEEICGDIIDNKGIEKEGYFESNVQCVEEVLYEYYVFVDGKLFEIIERDEDWKSFYKASSNDDETINFKLRYNNGGEGFSEALSKAIKNI